MENIVLNNLKKSQFFWNSVEKLSSFYSVDNFKRIPDEIIIEPTNSCNLRCPVCPTHFAMKRNRGFMDYDLFKSIIDEFKDKDKKPKISMNFSGEPLLNKDIGKFTRYANENGHKTFISTNATIMPYEMIKDLIESGLTSIHLCIDGISKESQEAYRVGSEFEELKYNIESFIKIKKELGSSTPHISIQTLLTSFSEKEIDEIISWSESIGADNVNLKSLSMGSYTTKEIKEKYNYLMPTDKKLQRKQSKIYKTVCTTPLRQSLVYWNGDLGLCCVDFDNVIKLPNIKEKGYLNTLFSDEVVEKRKKGFQKQFALCKKCSLGNADYMGINVDFRK